MGEGKFRAIGEEEIVQQTEIKWKKIELLTEHGEWAIVGKFWFFIVSSTFEQISRAIFMTDSVRLSLRVW